MAETARYNGTPVAGGWLTAAEPDVIVAANIETRRQGRNHQAVRRAAERESGNA